MPRGGANNSNNRRPRDEAERLRVLTGAARTRNGRLAIDWLSRAQKPRWRMLALDSQLYNRERMRQRIATTQRTVVPSTSRPLTARELAAALNTNPWRLFRR